MAGVPYSFGYSNKSAVERQPIYSSSVWWAGMNDFPLTPSGPLVRTAYATFIDLVSASDPTTYRCVATAEPTLLAMIPANFGDGTSYKPTLFGMKAGVSVQIPYNPTVWVADSDRGVLQFTVPPAQLGYTAPFGLTYYQYTEHGNVFVPKNLVVGGDLTIDGEAYYLGGQIYEDNLTVCGWLDVSGRATFHSGINVSGSSTFTGNVGISGSLTVSSATTLNASLYVSGPAVFNSTVDVSGPLTVSGSSTFAGDLGVNGSLTASGATTLNASLYVSGPAVFNSTVAVSGPLTVSGSSTFAGNLGVNGSLTVSSATTLNASLYVSGPAVFNSTVDVSGPLTVSGSSTFAGNVGISGSLTVSNGISLNGPITLAGTGQGSAGYVLTSQGAATPTWTAAIGSNFLPTVPSLVATPTSVSINEGIVLTFITNGDYSGFRVQDGNTLKNSLTIDRWGLHGYFASGTADNFNTLIAASGPIPMYYTLIETSLTTPTINLPSPLNYPGVQFTIKSVNPSLAVEITSGAGLGTLILPNEREPSAPPVKQFNVGGIMQAYSDGTYWISTIYYGGSP